MIKRKIMEYVLKSPHNTNPAVLNGMLNMYANSIQVEEDGRPLITFMIGERTFSAKKGMTFGDWVHSIYDNYFSKGERLIMTIEYDPVNEFFYLVEKDIHNSSYYAYVKNSNGSLINASRPIIENYQYQLGKLS